MDTEKFKKDHSKKVKDAVAAVTGGKEKIKARAKARHDQFVDGCKQELARAQEECATAIKMADEALAEDLAAIDADLT